MSKLDEEGLLKAELAQLRQEHRALDSEITRIVAESPGNQIALQRMKKQKLALKDRIARIEDQLYPDIIA